MRDDQFDIGVKFVQGNKDSKFYNKVQTVTDNIGSGRNMTVCTDLRPDPQQAFAAGSVYAQYCVLLSEWQVPTLPHTRRIKHQAENNSNCPSR